ncbi:MAG: hypothetical protein HY059_20270 [Proteobacteria bacterium]|nr:hypothetical protein [Pseudomonadota bacterium]
MKLVPLLLCGLIALDGTAGTRAGTGSPFALGMEKRVALALAGPDAIAGVLCGGIDAVMVERGADSAMAGFTDGRVAEIEAIDGAPPKCRDAFERGFAAAVVRWGIPASAPADGAVGVARTRTAEFRVRGVQAELVERRFPGGACDVRLLVRADEV